MLAALVLAAGACLILAPAAAAHALLLHSSPAADETLVSSPSQIVLTFSEAPDPNLSLIGLVDTHGRTVPRVSKARPVAGKPTELLVTLSSPLPKGVYTVDWRAVSTVDGHVSGDSFAFGVGVVPPSSGPAVRAGGQSGGLTAAAVAGKWLLYLGLILMVGAAATTPIALGGTLPAGGRAVLRSAWGLALVGVAVLMEAERAAVGLHSLLPFFQSKEGWPLVLQAIAVLACGVAIVGFELWSSRWLLAAVGAAAAAAMFLHAMAGHANGPSSVRVLNLVVQWVHLLGVGVWVGGLAWLLIGVRRRQGDERVAAVRRFSRLAGYALAAVAVTGLLRAVSEVGSPGDLVTTSFGTTLLVKVGLFLALAPLGALNRYRSLPALLGGDGGQRVFQWTSRAELILAAGILGLTALLSGLAPANVAAASRTAGVHQVVVSGADYATTVRVTLAVTPGTVGANTFVAQVTDYASGRVAAVSGVKLEFSLPSHPDVGPSALDLKQAADGTWRGSGLELSVMGDWACDAVIQESANAVVVALKIRAALP